MKAKGNKQDRKEKKDSKEQERKRTEQEEKEEEKKKPEPVSNIPSKQSAKASLTEKTGKQGKDQATFDFEGKQSWFKTFNYLSKILFQFHLYIASYHHYQVHNVLAICKFEIQ